MDRVLVVLPTLNERSNIDVILRRIRAAVPSVDVLVVDDASTDGTADRAELLAGELGHVSVLRRVGKPGLGEAYRAGFAVGLRQGYDILVEMDADLSHDPGSIPALITEVDRGADLVIGSRYVPGGTVTNWSLRRRAISRAGGLYARAMLGFSVHDPTSGFRAFRATLLRRLALENVQATGYGFQIETVRRAIRADARVVEVPIAFRDRSFGVSKMSLGIAAEALILVTRWSFEDRFRSPHRGSRTATAVTPATR